MIDILYENKIYHIKENHNRLYMYFDGSRIAELINGKEGLKKQYNNDYIKWIKKIEKRDLKRMDNIEYQIYQLGKEKIILTKRWY